MKYLRTYGVLIILFFTVTSICYITLKIQKERVGSLKVQVKELQKKISSASVDLSPLTQKDQFSLEKDLVALQKDLISLENTTEAFIVQALGGAFFFVTAFFSWRNLVVTQEKQITERFSKGIEQLGNTNLSIRLGGIYSLERIAKDSPKDHVTVMDILSTFVQETSPSSQEQEVINRDVQAVLYAIGQRKDSLEPKNLGFTLDFTNLRGANFFRGDFRRFGFKSSDMRNADLRQANCSEADFTEAKLSGSDLHGANFTKAIVKNADFRDVKGLTRTQIMSAYDWETATYDNDFYASLNLPPKSNSER